MEATIRHALVPLLREAFPEAGVRFSDEERAFATFPSPCEGLGDVEIDDDGDEATIHICGVAHVHIDGHGDEFAAGDRSAEHFMRIVAERVVHFLRHLFSDRYLLWRSPDSKGMSDLDMEMPQGLGRDADFFVWSKRLELQRPSDELLEAFLAGQRSDRIPFVINDSVEITAGQHKGSTAAVVSIERETPIRYLRVELGESGAEVILPDTILERISD